MHLLATRRSGWRLSLILLALISGLNLTAGVMPAHAQTLALPFTSSITTSPIARENTMQGTTSWLIPATANLTFIQGYVNHVSASPGQTVQLYVSAAAPVGYAFAVYRLGWYQGAGAREVTWVNHLRARSQGTWSPQTGLRGCTSCRIDATTHLVDAHWTPAYTLHIGADWLSGVYLIKLVANNGAMSYIPLIIRADTSHAAIVVNIAVNTYEAYNLWGDYDLYGDSQHHLDQRATKVSFNRPYHRSAGAGDLFYWDIQAIRWLERSGFDVQYTTDVDISLAPLTLTQHQVVLSPGHQEYWTKAMRDGFTAARDQGVSLAFLGANDGYWQVRYEPDANSVTERVLVCYKVATASTDPTMQLNQDPFYPTNPSLVTAQFRDPILGEPENALLGIMYASLTQEQDVPDWVVADDTVDQFAAAASLTPGEHIHGGLVGYEYDSSFTNGAQPANLVVLAASPLVNRYGKQQTAFTTYYRASSGAMVFDAGTLWWSWGLDAFSWSSGYATANRLQGNQHIMDLTAALLRTMLAASSPQRTTTMFSTPHTVP